MRFRSKVDAWIVVVLLFAALITIGFPLASIFAAGNTGHHVPLLAPVIWLLWAIMLASALPQYYEVREDGLFLRQGWRKILVPYASLAEVKPASNTRSAAVFSTHRILIVAQTGGRYLIAPVEQERFISEVARRAPQLERHGLELRLPQNPPVVH